MIEIRATKTFPGISTEIVEVKVEEINTERALVEYDRLARALLLPQKVVETHGKD